MSSVRTLQTKRASRRRPRQLLERPRPSAADRVRCGRQRLDPAGSGSLWPWTFGVRGGRRGVERVDESRCGQPRGGVALVRLLPPCPSLSARSRPRHRGVDHGLRPTDIMCARRPGIRSMMIKLAVGIPLYSAATDASVLTLTLDTKPPKSVEFVDMSNCYWLTGQRRGAPAKR